MKRTLVLLLALALSACAAVQPVAQPTALPQASPVPPTAQVIVATVEVPVEQTVVVTQVIPATEMPTQAPAATEPPTQAAATQAAPTTGATGSLLTISDNLGGGFFKNMTYSSDALALRCLNKSVTFNLTSANPAIVNVEFYYRVHDKGSVDISPWISMGNMVPDQQGNFLFAMAAENINPDWRRAQTEIDVQFVGLAKSGDAVGRSEKILTLLKYSNDCP